MVAQTEPKNIPTPDRNITDRVLGNHVLDNFVESMLTSNNNEVLHQVQHSAILENSVYHDHPEIDRQMPVKNVQIFTLW